MNKIIEFVINSKNARTLISNFSFLSLLQIGNYVIPIFTIPYLAKTIGIDRFGEIAFASTVMMYFQTVVDYGFSYTATRDIARNRESKEEISKIFSAVMWANIFLMIISFVILIVLIFVVPKFWEIKTVLLLSFCIIPGSILFPQWLYQGLEKMKYITILNLLARFFFAFAVFVFIKKQSDYILQPLFISLGFIIAGLFSICIILFQYKIIWEKPDIILIKKVLKNSSDVFINQISPNLYNSFSAILLGFFYGDYANGILDAGKKLALVVAQFMQVISITFFPFLSRSIDKHEFYARYLILLSVIVSIMLFFGAPILIKMFFSKEYHESINVLKIFSLYPMIVALSDVYGKNYLIIIGCEKKMRNITIICSLFGFVVVWPVVYFMGYIGAALTSVIIAFVTSLCLMITVIRLKNRR